MGSNHSFQPPLARELAHASGAAVVSVDYRLAPESPPPAQFDDAYAATEWVAAQADTLVLDAGRLAVVGDSAGGSLAAAVALAARDHGGPKITAQVLLYPPGLDRDMGTTSITSMPDAPMLRHDDILYMHELVDQGGGGAAGSLPNPGLCKRSARPAARHRGHRGGVRPDPGLGGRTLRVPTAGCRRADDAHALPGHVPRLPDAL